MYRVSMHFGSPQLCISQTIVWVSGYNLDIDTSYDIWPMQDGHACVLAPLIQINSKCDCRWSTV